MTQQSKETASGATAAGSRARAWFVGGGIGSLSAAAFLIRDGGWKGEDITILEELQLNGGSCDGIGRPDGAYVIRGGRMMNLPTYECTWALFDGIPSLTAPGQSVYREILDFNARIKTNAKARLVTRDRQKVDVEDMGFSHRDRMELLALTRADEDRMGSSRISDWFSPEFFKTNFWYMWQTTFAFQTWHSAAELKRYMNRFMHEFPRIQTLAGVARTPYNQYDSLVKPLEAWLKDRGVRTEFGCKVTDLDLVQEQGAWRVTGIQCERGTGGTAAAGRIAVGPDDLVFMQNGCITESSSLGSMTEPPKMLSKQDGGSWTLWEKVARGRPEFGNPAPFCDHVSESVWESFTVTLRDTRFFERMQEFSGNEAGTGALVTFKDSNWLLSVVLAAQPHFVGQPMDVQVFWGYSLYPDRVGNFVNKAMKDCSGREILQELCGHLGFEYDSVFAAATCIPCMMPFIDALFQARRRSDRPLPVPANSKNLGFISQFVEIPDDVIFTVEYSVRAAQIAAYRLAGIDKPIPAVHHYEKTLKVMLQSVKTAYRTGKGPLRHRAASVPGPMPPAGARHDAAQAALAAIVSGT
jgi:oleate hydratase